MKLYHCQGARSFRCLWTLEELGVDYELEVMPFPPRFRHEGYLEINPLGTVPAFVTDDGELMTESTAICEYLVNQHIGNKLVVKPSEAGYPDYLNFIHQSDATLTFPQTLFLRYKVFETERGLEQAGDDYTQWFFSRLKGVGKLIGEKEFVAAHRFTVADICFSYALKLAASLQLGEFPPNVQTYWERMQGREGYQRALEIERPDKDKKKG